MKALHKLMALAIAGSFAAGAPQLALAQVTAKFAVTLPEKSHQGQGVAKFIELVEAKSGGKIKIKGFYSGALGNDVQVTSALQGGTIEFTVPQTTTLTGMIKEYEILDFPFLFSNVQQAEKVLDGPVGDKLLAMLPAKGLVGLAYWENGFFNATNSKHPIAKAEDFEGLKFRSIQAKITQETIKALGAVPVPLAIPELYTALETRTVDDQPTGSYTVILSRDGWDPVRLEAVVARGETATLDYAYVPGSISIACNLPDAAWRALYGPGGRVPTLSGRGEAALADLPTGDYSFEFSREGWEPIVADVTVAPGKAAAMNAHFPAGRLVVDS